MLIGGIEINFTNLVGTFAHIAKRGFGPGVKIISSVIGHRPLQSRLYYHLVGVTGLDAIRGSLRIIGGIVRQCWNRANVLPDVGIDGIDITVDDMTLDIWYSNPCQLWLLRVH